MLLNEPNNGLIIGHLVTCIVVEELHEAMSVTFHFQSAEGNLDLHEHAVEAATLDVVYTRDDCFFIIELAVTAVRWGCCECGGK
jgi:hypothetical protein